MPCPHCKITIIKRGNNESAVSAAAYQSGEKLFSEYDQEQKYYPYKNEVTHKEIMLPPHVLPEYFIGRVRAAFRVRTRQHHAFSVFQQLFQDRLPAAPVTETVPKSGISRVMTFFSSAGAASSASVP